MKKKFDLIQKIKKIKGRKWSETKKCWHLPYTNEAYQALNTVFEGDQVKIKNSSGIQDRSKPLKDNEPDKARIHPKIRTYTQNGIQRFQILGDQIIINKNQSNWLEAYVPSDKINWIKAIREITGRKWDVENCYWQIPNVKESFYHLREFIGLQHIAFNFKIESDIPEAYTQYYKKPKHTIPSRIKRLDLLNKEQITELNKVEELLILKRYSINTNRSYKNHLIALFHFHDSISPSQLNDKQLQDYLLFRIRSKRIAVSTQNQIINAYKFYAEYVLKRPKHRIEIPSPKVPKALPNVLSVEEVTKLISSPQNIKHKLILLLLYSSGLRLSEVVNIKKKDINKERRIIHIRHGKGNKDRIVTLAENVTPFLEKYLEIYKPTNWLFEGQTGGQYSKRSVQSVFYRALEQSKIHTYATVHTLRHSYATHCVENGYSIALIQEALGHNSIKTTERYLHVSSVALRQMKSPLDSIKIV